MGHLLFTKNRIGLKVVSFFVHNKKKENLGMIAWDNEWDCWTWNPEPDLRMSADCLEEITFFLQSLVSWTDHF